MSGASDIEFLATFMKYLKKIQSYIDSDESKWLAKVGGQNRHMDHIINSNNIEMLQNFGKEEVSRGLGAYCYYAARSSPDILNYVNHHKSKFLENTSLTIKDIYVPNKYGLWGELYENNTQVVTPVMYRQGYISHVINSYSTAKRMVILEIGAGWGCLGFLVNRLMNCCYIIIDIPSTIMISLYFLTHQNKKIYVDTDINKLDDDIINNYDFIFILPDHIDNIPDNFVDFVVNTDSLCEMPTNCIENYLKLSNRIIKKNGYFYEYNCPDVNFNFMKENEKTYLNSFKTIYSKVAPISAYIPRCKGISGSNHMEYTELLMQKT